MIPEGWKVCELGNLCDSISITHPCKKGELIFLNTGDIENGFVLTNKYMNIKDMPGQAKKSIKENDILYSEIRPINRHYAFVNFPAHEYIVSTKLMVIRAINEKLSFSGVSSSFILYINQYKLHHERNNYKHRVRKHERHTDS